jgi:hypothetical protein
MVRQAHQPLRQHFGKLSAGDSWSICFWKWPYLREFQKNHPPKDKFKKSDFLKKSDF